MVEWTKNKANVIGEWVKNGEIREIEPLYLLFLIWGTTQFYADFDSEIGLIKGRPLTEKEFSEAEKFTVDMVLKGLDLK
jgi:TetR/AcrR family transcriptional regulator